MTAVKGIGFILTLGMLLGSLAAHRDLNYYLNVLGLQLTARQGKTAYLKGWDERHAYSIALTEAERPGMVRLAFRTVDPEDLDYTMSLTSRNRGSGEDLARRPTLLLRYTRLLLTEALRRQMHDPLGYGLGMELLALGEKPEGPA